MKFKKNIIFILLLSMLIVGCGLNSKYYKKGEQRKSEDIIGSVLAYSEEDRMLFSKELTEEEFETIFNRLTEQISLRKNRETYKENPKQLVKEVGVERRDIIFEGLIFQRKRSINC